MELDEQVDEALKEVKKLTSEDMNKPKVEIGFGSSSSGATKSTFSELGALPKSALSTSTTIDGVESIGFGGSGSSTLTESPGITLVARSKKKETSEVKGK